MGEAGTEKELVVNLIKDWQVQKLQSINCVGADLICPNFAEVGGMSKIKLFKHFRKSYIIK